MSGPRPDSRVRLELAGAGWLGARVVQARDGVLILRLLAEAVSAAGPLEPGEARGACVEWATGRGLARLRGVVRPAVLSSARPRGLCDLLRFDAGGQLRVLQRRDFARVDAVIAVDFADITDAAGAGGGAPADGDGSPASPDSPPTGDAPATSTARSAGPEPQPGPSDGYTLDLSGNGLLISDPYALALRTRVRLALDLPDGGPPVVVTGEVVREAAEGRKGVRIDQIADADRERIVRFVFARQRLTAAVLREP